MAMDEKIRSVSVMRVIAMLMIVCFHSLCFYTHRWWIFGGVYIPLWDKIASCLDAIDLPMFFFISGYGSQHSLSATPMSLEIILASTLEVNSNLKQQPLYFRTI